MDIIKSIEARIRARIADMRDSEMQQLRCIIHEGEDPTLSKTRKTGLSPAEHYILRKYHGPLDSWINCYMIINQELYGTSVTFTELRKKSLYVDTLLEYEEQNMKKRDIENEYDYKCLY